MPLFIGHMIPDFIVAALDNQPLLIYGDDKFTMTLCYISDAIDAALKMMASSEAGPFNIGASEEYKVSEVAKKIIKMTNSKSEIQYSDPLLFMSRLSIPNISMAKEKLEWFPVIILDKGLEETIEYARAHKVLIDWNRVEKVED
jgi:nucleoside-diphosphate-sugar epimerase